MCFDDKKCAKKVWQVCGDPEICKFDPENLNPVVDLTSL